MSTSNSSVISDKLDMVGEVNGGWKISGNFSPGENMTVFVAWWAATYGEDLKELPANVTIIANNKTTADFQVFFLQDPESSAGQEPGLQRVYVARIQLLYNEGESLQVDDPPRQIGGIVKQAGTYETRVNRPPDWFPWGGPEPQPPDLKLYRTIINRAYPYRDLLPIGAVTVVFGGILSIWAARADRGAVRTKKLRARRSR